MGFGVFLLLCLVLILGYHFLKFWLQREERRQKNDKALESVQLVRRAPRLTYLQRIQYAKECFQDPDSSLPFALSTSLKKETEKFHTREWTVETAQKELRLLAKDLEIAQQTPISQKYHSCKNYLSGPCLACQEDKEIRQLYTKAVEQEFVDSIGDLERKVQHLLEFLMRADYNAFLFSVTQQGIVGLAEKFELGTKIKRNWQELYAATLTDQQVNVERLRLEEQSLRYQLSIARLEGEIGEVKKNGTQPLEHWAGELNALVEKEEPLKQLYPAIEKEIGRKIESERIRLEDEL